MIAPESINPLTLPSVFLSERKRLPEKAGIYFCVSENNTILYIGRAKNLFQRWAQHHRYAELNHIGNIRLAWIEVSDEALLIPVEKALIKYFSPSLNSKIIRIKKVRNGFDNRTRYGVFKKPFQFMLTDQASDMIDKIADELGITRSEALERAVRGGGMEAAKHYVPEVNNESDRTGSSD